MHYDEFWPSQQHGAECFATEAEAISDAVFLAVHQSMPLYRSPVSNASERESRTEEDLLRALLERNPASGTLLLPIVGDSGVGKSHMIHWLDAQLRHRPDGIRRRVTRIPKSASLRSVLQRILEGLEGPEYDAIRREMITAQLALSPIEATIGLREKLLLELDRRNKEARAQCHVTVSPSLQQIVAFTDPGYIPALLQDPQLNSHFMRVDGIPKGVLCRIAERAIQGAHTQEGPENQFTEQDLTFPGVELGNLAADTRMAVQVLSRNNGDGRRIAVRILNDVVDSALASLLKFDGSSLSDLFVRLRRQLLTDETELVLLVEDFAALAGIQGSLLDAMIRQAVENGTQTLCVMRTALAVTKGYLANRETVLTRARYEWHIEDRPFHTEEEALETYANFIGGYLNAARWGQERLERDFKGRSLEEETLQDWLPDFYRERKGDLGESDHVIIQAFGFSSRGNHPLFPFNKDAIRQVLRRKFFKQGVCEFNPRRLLGLVLRDTLIENRPVFEKREFPPSGWLQFQRNLIDVSVLQEISRRQPGAVDRLACLVFHWGNAPESPGEAAAMPVEVYTAFHAHSISWSEEAIVRPEISTETIGREPAQTPQSALITSINQWRAQGKISQNDANKIRIYLRDEIREWIDWDALLLKQMPLEHRLIHLPSVPTGNPTENQRMARASENDALDDGAVELRFFSGLLAVVRYRDNSCSWNYQGGEVDAAHYRAIIEPMVVQTIGWLRKKSHGQTPDGVKILAQALLLGARLLRINGAAANSHAENIKAMLTEASPADSAADVDDQWSKIREQARTQRPAMLAKLKLFIIARQGGAEKINAVDAPVLLSAMEELRTGKMLPAEADLQEFVELPIREHLRQLRGSLKAAVENRAKKLGEWHAKVTGFLGENFEITDVIKQLRDAITGANQAHVYRQKEQLLPSSLSAKIGDLQQFKIKETLDLAKTVADASDLAVKINSIAQVDVKVEAGVLGTLEQFESFLDQTEREVNGRLNGLPPSPADQGKHLAEVVGEIEKRWEELENIK